MLPRRLSSERLGLKVVGPTYIRVEVAQSGCVRKSSFSRTTAESVVTHRNLPEVNRFLPFANSKRQFPIGGDENRNLSKLCR